MENTITGYQLVTEERFIDNDKQLLENIIPRSGVVSLVGASDTGKSMILRSLSIAIANGSESFLDFKLNANHKKVLFVSTEDSYENTRKLLLIQLGDDEKSVLKNITFIFYSDNYLESIGKYLDSNPTDLVIIDCFADIFKGEINKSTEVRTFLNSFKNLANKHECIILFMHHTGKRTELDSPSKNNVLGSQGFEASMRLLLELRMDNSHSNKRHLCILKGNYISQAEKSMSFLLEFNEESLSFKNTGERIPFEMLNDYSKKIAKIDLYKRAVVLQKEGNTLDQIAEKIGIQTKGQVSKLLSEGNNNGWAANQ
jgi:RecA-family ATPase